MAHRRRYYQFDDDNDDDKIAYFSMRWNTRNLV